MHFEGQGNVKQEKGLVKNALEADSGAEVWDKGHGPWVKRDTHTNRFSNRHIPQVIDLELLYQLILRRWEFHCGKEWEDQSW